VVASIGDLTVFKVTKTECEEVCNRDCARVYTMKVLPTTGNIALAGFFITIYRISEEDGNLQEIFSISNWNVIDFLVPLSPYKIVAVDRGGFASGRLSLRDTLNNTCNYFGNSVVTHGNTAKSHVVLETYGNIVAICDQGDGLCFCRLPEPISFPTELAKIRKYSRLIAQGYRTTSSLTQLPKELLVKIIAFMFNLEQSLASMVILDHFCKPPLYHRYC